MVLLASSIVVSAFWALVYRKRGRRGNAAFLGHNKKSVALKVI